MKSELSEAEDERKKTLLESLAWVLENGFATASDRQRRLIQYLVAEELEGRGDRLKAISIAIDVLGRSADFDLKLTASYASKRGVSARPWIFITRPMARMIQCGSNSRGAVTVPNSNGVPKDHRFGRRNAFGWS
jgi:hypothetical protein